MMRGGRALTWKQLLLMLMIAVLVVTVSMVAAMILSLIVLR
jgi:hypothetical protein